MQQRKTRQDTGSVSISTAQSDTATFPNTAAHINHVTSSDKMKHARACGAVHGKICARKPTAEQNLRGMPHLELHHHSSQTAQGVNCFNTPAAAPPTGHAGEQRCEHAAYAAEEAHLTLHLKLHLKLRHQLLLSCSRNELHLSTMCCVRC